MTNAIRWLILLALPFSGPAVSDDLYGCPAPGGGLVFTDLPCRSLLRTQGAVADGALPAGPNTDAVLLAARFAQAEVNIKSRSDRPVSVESRAVAMSYPECQAARPEVINLLNDRRAKIQSATQGGGLSIDRVPTASGSVLVICSEPDHRMLLTRLAAR